MKRSFLLVLFSVLLVACSSDINEGHKVPDGKVIIDNNEYSMNYYQYEWKEDNIEFNTRQTNTLEEQAKGFDNISVDKSNEAEFNFEKSPLSVSVLQQDNANNSKTIEVKNQKIILPSDEGYYVYEVTAEWKEGTVTYLFDVEVK